MIDRILAHQSRLDWNVYLLQVAKAVSLRASCSRAFVGSVIAEEHHRILSTGYNGAISGAPSCLELGCLIYNNHCLRSNHAEFNAVSWCRQDMSNSTVYIYDSNFRQEPCPNCQAVLKAAGINKAVLALQEDCRQYVIVPLSDDALSKKMLVDTIRTLKANTTAFAPSHREDPASF